MFLIGWNHKMKKENPKIYSIYREINIPKCNKKINHFWSGKIVARLNKRKKVNVTQLFIENNKNEIPFEKDKNKISSKKDCNDFSPSSINFLMVSSGIIIVILAMNGCARIIEKSKQSKITCIENN